jgi:hypothetical protein
VGGLYLRTWISSARRRIERASCHACIRKRASMFTPKSFSMRSAISGDSAALPFFRQELVWQSAHVGRLTAQQRAEAVKPAEPVRRLKLVRRVYITLPTAKLRFYRGNTGAGRLRGRLKAYPICDIRRAFGMPLDVGCSSSAQASDVSGAAHANWSTPYCSACPTLTKPKMDGGFNRKKSRGPYFAG